MAASIAATACAGHQARADVSLSEKGSVAHLQSSRLQPGDEQTFAEFLNRTRSQPLKIIYLDSRGGNTHVAIAIGRLIRDHGLDTAFKPAQARCVSACTTMFVGGVHRYYVEGVNVSDGVGTRYGLGFHPSGGVRGEEDIAKYYHDMGVEGASSLRFRIFPKDAKREDIQHHPLFFAGGRAALDAGVATSLDVPPEKDLQE